MNKFKRTSNISPVIKKSDEYEAMDDLVVDDEG